ncbi:type IV toxin-antitoxin system AbiEi family antitoxin [Polaromonas sp.]|uniref:type IV toxin-antitoxin system AbiEi family antitoxin n=1 Tax=Polaromonas sp. TaxID=1869339 RepID=UPI00386215D1
MRRRFWHFPQADGDGDGDACVPPVLVYADLLATGDARCIETAKRLYETHVVRPVRQA